MKYYEKEIVSNSLLDSTGKPFPFEPFGNENGLLQVDDSTPDGERIAKELKDLSDKHIGGVVVLTEGEYSSKKAAYPLLPPSAMKSEPPLRVLQTRSPLAQNGLVVEDKGSTAPILSPQAPVHIPTTPPSPVPDFKPRRGKLPTTPAQVQEMKAIAAAQTAGKA